MITVSLTGCELWRLNVAAQLKIQHSKCDNRDHGVKQFLLPQYYWLCIVQYAYEQYVRSHKIIVEGRSIEGGEVIQHYGPFQYVFYAECLAGRHIAKRKENTACKCKNWLP